MLYIYITFLTTILNKLLRLFDRFQVTNLFHEVYFVQAIVYTQ